MQRDDAFEIVGQMRAPVRLALGESLMLAVVGRRQMIDAGEQGAEMFAVGDNAADRNAAKTDAVIAALAADQPGARGLPAHIMIGERDLERGVDRFRAGIAEEHAVEIGWRQRRDPACQLERFGVGELERRRIIELLGLRGLIALTIGSRLWPALVHHRPAVPSSTARSSGCNNACPWRARSAAARA